MSEIKFKTEWLTQIALLAACGTADDVADLCTAIQRASLDLPVNEMSSLTETLFHPIAESINESRTKSERNRTNRQRKVNENERPLEEEKEEKEEKNQKKKENKREEYNTSVDNTNVLSPSVSCAEAKESPSAPTDPPLISFLCTKGQEFGVTQEFYEQLCEAYPAVNAMEQLKKIKSWCFANPKLRKTKGGAMRFVNNWFAKEQDRAAPPNARSGTIGQRRLTAEEVAALPAIDPFAELRGG